jgi:hypothetical protein
MRMRAGVQHQNTMRACKPVAGRPAAALANLVACGTDLTVSVVEWRMPGGTTSFPSPRFHRISSRHSRTFERKEKFDANAGRTTSGALGFEPPMPSNRHWQNVLPFLVAFVLMSRCECRWNYSLLSSWSRVRIPPVPIIRGTLAQSGRARSFHQPLSQRGISFAVNADGTTGKRTRRIRKNLCVPLAACPGLPGSSPGPAMDGGMKVSSTLVTCFLQ